MGLDRGGSKQLQQADAVNDTGGAADTDNKTQGINHVTNGDARPQTSIISVHEGYRIVFNRRREPAGATDYDGNHNPNRVRRAD